MRVKYTHTSRLSGSVDSFQINYALAPNDSGWSFRRWVENGVSPGSFIMGLLHNDLMEAAGSADHINAHLLVEYAIFIHSELPRSCWGGEAFDDVSGQRVPLENRWKGLDALGYVATEIESKSVRPPRPAM